MNENPYARHAPFEIAGKKNLLNPNLRADLFGAMDEEQIWADFVSWLEVRHSGIYLDLELLDDAARMLAAIGCLGLDAKLSQWYLATHNENRLAILSTFLDGYWMEGALTDESIINMVIEATAATNKTLRTTDYASSVWMLFKICSRDKLRSQISEAMMNKIKQFLRNQKITLQAENKLMECAPCLASFNE